MDSLAKVTISRQGDVVLSDETVVDEIDIFQGSENQITFDKIYTKSLKCIYQLQLYPFDTQECTVDLEVGEYDKDTMMVHPHILEMKGETLLPQYFITNWFLEYRHTGQA